jgi:hypothetical protein
LWGYFQRRSPIAQDAGSANFFSKRDWRHESTHSNCLQLPKQNGFFAESDRRQSASKCGDLYARRISPNESKGSTGSLRAIANLHESLNDENIILHCLFDPLLLGVGTRR